jgi:aspartokinase-like uncharacterized kinase
MITPTIVVKVGGSLMDWPELGPRLKDWLSTLLPAQILLVPGGGQTVDVVRDLDRCHGLREESAHWLALRALTVNANFLADILTSLRAMVVADFGECESAWARNELPVLDPLPFARKDESQPGRLPHSWSATSDSLAARVGWRIRAQKLILLKSTTVPPEGYWKTDSDFVDSFFPKIIDQAASAGIALEVSALNFREWLVVKSQ